MRAVSPMAALFLVGACSGTPSTVDWTVALLPDTEPESFQFTHGAWHRQSSIYAFLITPTSLDVIDDSVDEPIEYHLSIEDCPEIADSYRNLFEAFFRSTSIAAARAEPGENREIVLDGPDYRLAYWSRIASTVIVLDGDSNSQLATPWVDAAYEVRALGDKCGIAQKAAKE